MGKFSQPSLAFYLGAKREKLLFKSFSSSLNPEGGGHEPCMVGEMINEAMDEKRRFLRSLASSSSTGSAKKLLKRGHVDLPLVGPAIGVTSQFTPPDTETLQTKSIKAWIESYWKSHGFKTTWSCRSDNPDSVEMDWPRPANHVTIGPPTHIWVLRIYWD
jgi:hypothetical protein